MHTITDLKHTTRILMVVRNDSLEKLQPFMVDEKADCEALTQQPQKQTSKQTNKQPTNQPNKRTNKWTNDFFSNLDLEAGNPFTKITNSLSGKE